MHLLNLWAPHKTHAMAYGWSYANSSPIEQSARSASVPGQAGRQQWTSLVMVAMAEMEQEKYNTIRYNCMWYCSSYRVQKCTHDHTTGHRWTWAIVSKGLAQGTYSCDRLSRGLNHYSPNYRPSTLAISAMVSLKDVLHAGPLVVEPLKTVLNSPSRPNTIIADYSSFLITGVSFVKTTDNIIILLCHRLMTCCIVFTAVYYCDLFYNTLELSWYSAIRNISIKCRPETTSRHEGTKIVFECQPFADTAVVI